MTKRSIVILIAGIILVAAVAVGGAVAYLTHEVTMNNVFTVGNVKVTLTEPNYKGAQNEQGDPILDSDGNSVVHSVALVSGGESFAKDPTVTLVTGSESAWIRATVTITADTLSLIHTPVWDSGWMEEGSYEDGQTGSAVHVLYYNQLLTQGSTSPIFSTVEPQSFSADTVESISGSLGIEVSVEALQREVYGAGGAVTNAVDAFAIYDNG